MTGSNLPPGVTPGDIDRHFGGEPLREAYVTMTVDIEVEARGRTDDELIKDARDTIGDELDEQLTEILHMEDQMIERR